MSLIPKIHTQSSTVKPIFKIILLSNIFFILEYVKYILCFIWEDRFYRKRFGHRNTQDYGVSTFLSVFPVLDLGILEQQIILEVCYSAHSWILTN